MYEPIEGTRCGFCDNGDIAYPEDFSDAELEPLWDIIRSRKAYSTKVSNKAYHKLEAAVRKSKRSTESKKDFQPIDLGAVKDDSSKPFCLICRESIENPINSHGPVLVKGVEGTICLKCARSSKANEVQYLWQKNVATKNDTSKPRYDLLPPEALEEIVKVLTFGASKYGDRNWEKGLSYSRCFAAMMRHLWAWWRGENLDPESGLSHLAHAGCCVLFLLTYIQRRHQTTDDRPTKR